MFKKIHLYIILTYDLTWHATRFLAVAVVVWLNTFLCFQVSALDQELIEVDPDTKEMLKLLVRFYKCKCCGWKPQWGKMSLFIFGLALNHVFI